MPLMYKTSGNPSPQGKPRVYFSCHPDDFDLYFEVISKEILDKQNCAIWYSTSNDNTLDEEQKLELSQMQLFVIPITTKLLTTSIRALDYEFPYAMENHIPLLPLMQEGNLVELFNKKCGNLQFLDKNSIYTSAINYDEKLRRYLLSVLIGDKLVAKIRDAFDAYIFLSYRKMDYKYAHKLMHLIHKNENLQNVAIWYDELLTPGKDYNRSINDMLTYSDIYTMVITPNILKIPNYIIDNEYPMALEQKKEILPVEMEVTNKEKLYYQFERIPKCIDCNQEQELFDTLLNMLRNLEKFPIKQTVSTPLQNYYLGLAYLYGIDVEVNQEKALILLKDSAENGVFEAIGKLGDIYNLRNQIDQVYEYYEKAFARNLQIAEEIQTIESRRDLSIDYSKLGDIYKTQGQLDQAKEYYEKAIEISLQIAEIIETVESLRDLSICYNNLGDVCKENGQLDKAKEYYERALLISLQLSDETKTIKSQRDLLISYNNLGDVCRANGQLEQAKEYYEKAIKISLQIAEKINTIESCRNLSINYSKLGDIYNTQGKLDQAKEYYEKAIKISLRIAEIIETVESLRDLSICYNKLGDLCRSNGQLKRV